MERRRGTEIRHTGSAESGPGGVSISGYHKGDINTQTTVHFHASGTTDAEPADILQLVHRLSQETHSIWQNYAQASFYGDETPYSLPLDWQHRAPLDHLRGEIRNAAKVVCRYRPDLRDMLTKIEAACDGLLTFCPEDYVPEESTTSFYLSHRHALQEHVTTFTSSIKVAGNSLSLEDVTTSASDDRHPSGPYDVDAPVGLHNQGTTLQRLRDTERFGSIESSAVLRRGLSGFAEGAFLGNKVPTDVLTSLDEFVTAREADPRGFHYADVESAYRVFLAAARALLKSTAEGMFPMKHREGWSEIPGEWYDEDRERWDKATEEILETWRGFLDAHDAFILSGHSALLN